MKQIITLLFLLLGANGFAQQDTLQVTLKSQEVGTWIPDNYSGLSYETRMVLPDAKGCYYFSKDNRKLVRMFKALNVKSLRLGGNSVDVKATATPQKKDLDALFGFAREAGVKVIYSVRLQNGSVKDAISQARYIWEHYADLLDYFAIGNEPGYYKDYERDLQPRWDELMKAMRTAAPKARFCAPDDNPNPVLCQKLIRDYWNNPLSLITIHSYPAGCAFTNPGKPFHEMIPYDYKERCDHLLSERLPREYAHIYNQMERVIENHPFRLSETNSFWYGGLDGASNAYASALWAIDYMYWWAERGNQGVNFHTGDKVGGTDIAAHYATFVTEGDGFDVRPLSYAMKMFNIGSKGRMFPVVVDENKSLTAYATKNDHGYVYVTVVNKEHGAQAKERVLRLQFDSEETAVLSAESLTMQCAGGDILARKEITIGGSEIAKDGTWKEGGWKKVENDGRSIILRMEPATAVVLKINTSYYHAISEKDEPAQYGKIKPTWQSMKKYQVPDWYRDAKFGIWAHWGPQSQPEYGDWYAHYMYKPGSRENKYHVAHYGQPSEVGFKDLIHQWKAANWNPDRLIELYKKAGAQYFVAMANHHDNFDLWDSKYHEWNSTAEGPHTNIIGRWAEAAKRQGLKFGVSVHASRAWNWYDRTEDCDGKLTRKQGKGQWWEGKDPSVLYARGHALNGTGATDKDGNPVPIPDSAYCENYYNRTMDLINKYHPDLVYFDDTTLPLWPESDAGLKIASHYYNSNMLWHEGKQEGVITTKGLTPEQQQCLVWDVERGALSEINPQPWQTCTCLGSWHYDRTRFTKNTYKTALRVIRMLADIVSKNGNLLLSVPVRADGTIDEREEAILDSIGQWMAVNQECIYGTRPWKKFGEGPDAENTRPMNGLGFNETKTVYTPQDIRFTQKGNMLYAIVMQRPEDGKVLVKSLAGKKGQVQLVEVMGCGLVNYVCDEDGLSLTLPIDEKEEIPVVKITLKKDFDYFFKNANYDETKIPAYTLPDPLLCQDGSKVTTAKEWEQKRRPELLELIIKEMYGRVPEAAQKSFAYKVVDIDKKALGGKAIRKVIKVYMTDDKNGPSFNLQLFLPHDMKEKVPLFLGLSFKRNEDIANAQEWQLDKLLSSGYGLATFYYQDITPDKPNTTLAYEQGIIPYYYREGQQQPDPDQWGSVSAWAWAAGRAMDYMLTDKQVDSKRIVVMGHSRLGKAALWAGATDQRFAAVVAAQSGCCGAALSRRMVGETIESVNTILPYWFCGNYKQYSACEQLMPFDQHEVIALIAPRPVYISSAEDDHWSDPRGEFLGAEGAKSVYKLYGKENIGYHIREGGHAVMPYDWDRYLSFLREHNKGIR